MIMLSGANNRNVLRKDYGFDPNDRLEMKVCGSVLNRAIYGEGHWNIYRLFGLDHTILKCRN